GMVLALVNMNRYPGPSVTVGVACGLMLLGAIVHTVILMYMGRHAMTDWEWKPENYYQIRKCINLGYYLLDAFCMVLILAAGFSGRGSGGAVVRRDRDQW